ncbi:MAG TPA: hypothetical protein VI749_07710 [Candidatus Omnitrophota bacterium]|nr:hypothetical protein [Candidatus Omnitrophota bacterium]
MEQQANETVITLIKELQKQITYLERKIDTLVAQSAGRQAGPKSYPPSSRSYGAHQRYENPRGSAFSHKRQDEGRRYVEKKKPFRPGDKDRAARSARPPRPI